MSNLAQEIEATLAPVRGQSTPVCRLRGISKVYYKPDGSVMVEALRHVDLDIPFGQYIAIMGPSGSGKSTLMNVLGCLDQPTTGTYHLDGKDVSTLADDELSMYRGRKIGFVFQAFNLISTLRIEENVEVPLFYQKLPRKERRRAALAALDLVGLHDRVGHRRSSRAASSSVWPSPGRWWASRRC